MSSETEMIGSDCEKQSPVKRKVNHYGRHFVTFASSQWFEIDFGAAVTDGV